MSRGAEEQGEVIVGSREYEQESRGAGERRFRIAPACRRQGCRMEGKSIADCGKEISDFENEMSDFEYRISDVGMRRMSRGAEEQGKEDFELRLSAAGRDFGFERIVGSKE